MEPPLPNGRSMIVNKTTNPSNRSALSTAYARTPSTRDPAQSSAFLLLPGELRNRIYDILLQSTSDNVDLFQEAHATASVCRQMRHEFWSYVLNQCVFKIDVEAYEAFLRTFFPMADPQVMKTYVGTFVLTTLFVGACYRNYITPAAKSRNVDLRPLLLLLRASSDIQITFDADVRWLCRRKPLEQFLRYARTGEEWVATPIIQFLRLRLQEAQMGDLPDLRTYWIVDVGLQRELKSVYEQVALLAYLEERKSLASDGVCFNICWDKEEKVPKKSWFSKMKKRVKKGLGKFFWPARN